MLQPKVSEIITEFLNENDENYIGLRNNLSQHKSIFQYVYSNVFPEIYCAKKGEVSTIKVPFTSFLKLTKTRKKWNH